GEHHLCATNARGDMFAATHELGGGVSPMPWSLRLREVLAAVRPDVIHVHGGEGVAAVAVTLPAGSAAVVVSVYGRLALPLASRPQTWRDHRRADMSLHRRLIAHSAGLPLLRAALHHRRIAAVCSPDPQLVEHLAPVGPAFLACGAAQPSTRRAQWSPHGSIVFAGRAETGRGIDDLLLAYLRVRRVRPDSRLVLALRPARSSARWADLRMAGVEIRSEGSGDLDDVLAGAQVAAVPLRMDATITPALVAAEAMAVGLPVVGTNVACLRPLLRDGHNGRVVAAGDAGALADALLDTLSSRARWEHLSAAARHTIEIDWHWDGAAAVVHDAYRFVTGQRNILAA
ncbi:glycosyltransferase, partial [Luteitalea sp.]|uniref:glycosyltransferase n=1 Tax=Luteitalea sp. TaxID=2004800 RepID=UPI0025C6E784